MTLFHYFFIYHHHFGHENIPIDWIRHGHLGVELFFIISGLVITSSISNLKHPIDFVVYRFARLFPIYWACVSITTFVIFSSEIYPNVSLKQYLYNLTMIQHYFYVPHIDGVYWTLTSELSFYLIVLVSIIARIPLVYWLLTLGWVSMLGEWIHFPISRHLETFLLLKSIFLFSIGVSIRQFIQGRWGWIEIILFIQSIGLCFVHKGMSYGVTVSFFALIVFMVISDRMAYLSNKGLTFLGKISYSFYLIHQVIGFVMIHFIYSMGLNGWVAIFISLIFSILFATLLNRTIEQPTHLFIRKKYQQSRLYLWLRPKTSFKSVIH